MQTPHDNRHHNHQHRHQKRLNIRSNVIIIMNSMHVAMYVATHVAMPVRVCHASSNACCHDGCQGHTSCCNPFCHVLFAMNVDMPLYVALRVVRSSVLCIGTCCASIIFTCAVAADIQFPWAPSLCSDEKSSAGGLVDTIGYVLPRVSSVCCDEKSSARGLVDPAGNEFL